MKKIIGITLIALLLYVPNFASRVEAARNISLPYSTDFSTNNISDLIWTECGGTVTWTNTQGYSGGAVKITPPTSLCTGGTPPVNGGMSAIGNFQGFSTQRLNIRFLLYVGSYYNDGFQGGGNKFIDVHAGSARIGLASLQKDGKAWVAATVVPFPSYWACFVGDPASATEWTPDHDSAFAAFKLNTAGNSSVWLCYEYEIDLIANTTRIRITKRDGSYTQISSNEETVNGNIDTFVIGGYHNGYGTANANNYLIIDNLKIDNTYIGPPDGFVGGTQIPNTPENLHLVE